MVSRQSSISRRTARSPVVCGFHGSEPLLPRIILSSGRQRQTQIRDPLRRVLALRLSDQRLLISPRRRGKTRPSTVTRPVIVQRRNGGTAILIEIGRPELPHELGVTAPFHHGIELDVQSLTSSMVGNGREPSRSWTPQPDATAHSPSGASKHPRNDPRSSCPTFLQRPSTRPSGRRGPPEVHDTRDPTAGTRSPHAPSQHSRTHLAEQPSATDVRSPQRERGPYPRKRAAYRSATASQETAESTTRESCTGCQEPTAETQRTNAAGRDTCPTTLA